MKNAARCPRLAVLCGLASEAAVAKRLKLVGGSVLVGVSAARAYQARQVLQGWQAAGVDALLSLGIAGGLAPHLPTSTILIPTSVHTSYGQFATAVALRGQMLAAAPAAETAPIWGSELPVVSVADKATLAQHSQCVAVDMESQLVAEAAHAANIPFAVLRVVCDTASQPLPALAQVPLQTNGAPNLLASLQLLLRQPRSWGETLQLAQNYGQALAALQNLVTKLPALQLLGQLQPSVSIEPMLPTSHTIH